MIVASSSSSSSSSTVLIVTIAYHKYQENYYSYIIYILRLYTTIIIRIIIIIIITTNSDQHIHIHLFIYSITAKIVGIDSLFDIILIILGSVYRSANLSDLKKKLYVQKNIYSSQNIFLFVVGR